MKKILFIVTLLCATIAFSQHRNIIKETFDEIKSKSKIDRSDSICYDLMQKMYDETLQSEHSELNESTIS